MRGKIIAPIIFTIIGIVLLVTTLQDWSADNKRFEAEKAVLYTEANMAANRLVDMCLNSLPNGDPSCDNLRQTIGDVCDTTENQLDACNDGRVEQYYQQIGIEQSNTAVVENVNTSNDPVITNEKPTDFRCFQRIDGMIDVNSTAYFGVAMYSELEDSACDMDRTGLQYNTIARYDILRAGSDWYVDAYGESEEQYTEYRLLNGTILAFGEKKIITAR